jgi:hypothetical protein
VTLMGAWDLGIVSPILSLFDRHLPSAMYFACSSRVILIASRAGLRSPKSQSQPGSVDVLSTLSARL